MLADVGVTAVEQRAKARGFRMLDEFVAGYLRWRGLGWTHAEIAVEMGYANRRTVGRLVSRARAAGLLPRPERMGRPPR